MRGGMTGWLVVLVAVLAPVGLGGQETLRLEEVVRWAVATHPRVEAERARAAASSHAAGEARAGWWPSVGATALATRYQEPMVVAPLHGIDPLSAPDFERTLVQGHLSAEWVLFDGGLRRSRSAAASRLAASAEAGAAAAADAVVVAAVSSYLAVVTSRAVLAAHERRQASLESEHGRALRMVEEGRAPRVEVLRTEAELSRAAAERETAAEGLLLALQRLARVSGLSVERVDGARLVDLAPSAGAPPDRDELVERARASHPGVVQAAHRAAAAEQSLAGARSLWLPRISLAGRYSAYGSSGTDAQPEWNVGTQVSYAVFNGGARSRSVDRAGAEARAAEADLAAVVREVEDGVEAALAGYRSASARARALEAAVAASAEVARIEALALEAGAGVQSDYLRAEAELLLARAGLAEARRAAVEARVRLAQATGELDAERLGDLLVEVES
jgi:outer membrane protein